MANTKKPTTPRPKAKKAQAAHPAVEGSPFRFLDIEIVYKGVSHQVAILDKPTGATFLEIGREMASTPDNYYPAAMRALLRLSTPDNDAQPFRKVMIQEWKDLDYHDFVKVMAKLIELGFQLGV